MKTLYLLRFNHLAGVGGLCLAFLLLAAPFARAGLTLEIHIYTQSQGSGYVFYTPLLTNATAPAAPLGTYVISSPQWPTNGAQRGFDLTTNGMVDRTEFDGEYGYGDLPSTLFQITNGTWSILFTNATVTNTYTFTVTAPVATSTTLPPAIITFPMDTATILTNQTNFTWQPPSGWSAGAAVQAYDFDDISYYQSAQLPAGQTNWNVDSSLPVGSNYTFTIDYLTTNNFFTASTPVHNAQPISGWNTLSIFEYGSTVNFGVVPQRPAPGSGHTCFAYYTFEDDNPSFPEDFSGNGNNLDATWFTVPPYLTNDAEAGSYAADITGSGWYSSINSLSNVFAGSFSTSLWLKTTNVPNNNFANAYTAVGIVSALGNDYSMSTMPMGQSGNKLAFYTGGVQQQNTLYSQASIVTGQYVHVVVTRDQLTGEKRIYINGVLDSSGFFGTDLLSSSGGPSLGYNNGNVFSGEVDEVQYYSGVLSSNDVAYLHSHPGNKVADTIQLDVPVGRYDFEDTNDPTIDSSGHRNNIDYYTQGSPADMPSTNAAVGNYAWQFLGNSQYLFTSGSQDFTALSNALTGSFSISAWVNTTNLVGSDFNNAYFGANILFLYNSDTNSTVPLSITGTKAACTIYDENGNAVTIHSTTTVNDGNYHLLTVTRDMSSGFMSLYVDGNLEATNTSSKSFLQIPWIHFAGGYYVNYQGLLDDVRIYAGVLSADDVATLAARGGPTFNSALGTSNLTWTTSGDANWFLESTNTYNGAPAAAQSGSVTGSQETILTTTVTGPGTLDFYWSSIANDPNQGFDYEFYIDDPNSGDIADLFGDNDWQSIQDSTGGPVAIPPGQHTLGWIVYANGDTDPTEAAYLDNVSYIPTVSSALTVTASPQSGPAPLTVQFTSPSMDGNGNTVTNWNWTFGDGGTSTAQSPSHIYTSLGSYSPSLTAYSTAGSTTLSVSGPGTITVTPLPPPTGNWTNTGSILSERFAFPLTVLPNGEVLASGGEAVFQVNTYYESDLYSPANGKWQETGFMNYAREEHTATLLTNGLVLAAGGFTAGSGGGTLSTCELYSPATGVWTNTGSMRTARYAHTAVLLTNGLVLVAGGVSNSILLASSEIYNPVAGTWTPTGNLNTTRYFASAFLLTNGTVLVVGGQTTNGAILSSAEIYNPATGLWRYTASPMLMPQSQPISQLLPDGQLLVAGGLTNGAAVSGFSELYDPVGDSWSQTGSMNTPREAAGSVLLNNGIVLVAGGDNGGNGMTNAELYDPGTGIWTVTGAMNEGRNGSFPMVLLANGEALATGGLPANNDLSTGTAELYTTTAATITILNPIKLAGGAFQFSFAYTPGAGSTVFTTTNLALPFTNWTTLGSATEVSPGQFQFTDTQTNLPRRFYRVRSP